MLIAHLGAAIFSERSTRVGRSQRAQEPPDVWKPGVQKTQVFLLSTLPVLHCFLTCGANIFSIANPVQFEGFQRDGESLVLGRLVNSRQDGPRVGGPGRRSPLACPERR